MAMNRRAEEILAQLKERLRSQLPSDIVSVICFGSYARGQETPDSDLDVLVVVKSKDRAIYDLIQEAAYAVMWTHGFVPLLSVKILPEEEWEYLAKEKTSFYESLQGEGITV
ncbi:MAG: nucleotidyltransferase domain-containing protein [Acidobacteria bacterium]|nr:nucleotidyltransferase domain-containing protein [Acidobacteriota bacterium]